MYINETTTDLQEIDKILFEKVSNKWNNMDYIEGIAVKN